MGNKLPSNLIRTRSKILLFDTNRESVIIAVETLVSGGVNCRIESKEVISVPRSKLAQTKRILNKSYIDYSII